MDLRLALGLVVILASSSLAQVFPGPNPYIGPPTLQEPSARLSLVGQFGYPQLNYAANPADNAACPYIIQFGMQNVSCTVPAFLVQGFIWANSSDPVLSAQGYQVLDSVFGFLNSGVSVSPGNDVWGYDDPQYGNAYALVGAANGLSIVDVTVPQAPREVGFFPGSYSIWRDIKTRAYPKAYAFYVQDNYQASFKRFTAVNQSYYDLLAPSDGLSIVDMSRADSPALVRHDMSIFTFAHNLFVEVEESRPYAYVCGGDITPNGGIGIIDVSDPVNPKLLHAWDNVYIHDVMVQARGDRYLLYGAAIYAKELQDAGLYIIDVTDPVNPFIVQNVSSTVPMLHNVWPTTNSEYIFCTHERNGAPITIYDARDLNDVKQIRTLYLTEGNDDISAHNLFIRDDKMFIAYYSMGTVVYDVSNPAEPTLVGTYDTYPQSWVNAGGLRGNWGVYPFAATRPELDKYYIYSMDITNGLFVTVIEPKTPAALIPALPDDCDDYTWLIVVTFILEALLALALTFLLYKRLRK